MLMNTGPQTRCETSRILGEQIHRMASGHLSVSGSALRVCQQSLATIEHFLPMIRDHENPEVRRIATPLLAMLSMTLRNVSNSMMETVVSPEDLSKTFEKTGLLDGEAENTLNQYREQLRYDEWGRIFGISEEATREADSIPEKRPR